MRLFIAPALFVCLFSQINLRAQNCSDFETWSHSLEKEFPDVDLSQVRTGSAMCNRIFYCLYSDKYFTPFAGKPFDEVTETGKTLRWRKVRMCNQKKKYANDKYVSFAHWIGLYPLTTKRLADELMPTIIAQRKSRIDYASDMKKLESDDVTFENVKACEQKLRGEYALLTTAEVNELSKRVSSRKEYAASRELIKRAEKISTSQVFTIAELSGFNATNSELFRLADSRSREAATVMVQNRLGSVIESIVKDERRQLSSMPSTNVGLITVTRFYNDFSRKYDQYSRYPVVPETKAMIIQRRTTIVNSLAPEIRRKVSAARTVSAVRTIESEYLDNTIKDDSGIEALAQSFADRKKEIEEEERLQEMARLEAQRKQEEALERETAQEFAARTSSQKQAVAASNRDEGVYLVFPSVIDAVLDGDFQSVPDDQLFRTYLMSVYKGIYDQCEPNGNGIGMTAGKYGVPQFRDLNNFAAESLGDFFTSMMEAMKSGDITTMQPRTRPAFYRPGVEDGASLVKTYKCNSVKVRGLRMQFVELFEQRQNRSPQPDDAARWKNLMHPQWRKILGNVTPANPATRSELMQACIAANGASYMTEDRCRCMVPKLMSSSITDKERNELRQDWQAAESRLFKENDYFRRYVNDPCRQ